MTPIEAIALGWMIGRFIYHRWIHDWIFPPKHERVWEEIQIPRTDEGAVVPLLYGRFRVRSPILAWIGEVSSEPGSVGNFSPNAAYIYRATMFFILGIPFWGDNENKLHSMWEGEKKFASFLPGTGVGNPLEAAIPTELSDYADRGLRGSSVEWMNGNSTMNFDNSVAAMRMVAAGVDPTEIPGYHGFISALLFNTFGGWYFGNSPSVPSYSFEASSIQTAHSQLGTFCRVGFDSNPVNVIFDLLTGKMGKLGIPESFIDMTSFKTAQYTLSTESHGYSNAFDSKKSGEDHIMDVLRQIDGVFFQDPETSKLGIKLIRNDYDPATIPHITRQNCTELSGFSASGWDGVPNKIKIIFTNRDDEYRDGTAGAHNLANIDHQDGEVREQTIQMKGCCRQAQADDIAGRELVARSRPMMKCTAVVDGSFGTVKQGDAIKVTWNNPTISGIVFRVVAVDRGTLPNGRIRLDLIQDYFYVWRNQPPRAGTAGKLDTPPIYTK